ncbi:MAG: 4Fe-4S binding protein [Chloroflexi bacterium]|nr:4Fe-4S binding protein [Chloroflexota bacterium]
MIGSGIFKGLLVTLKHFFETYISDQNFEKNRNGKKSNRGTIDSKGLFTIQYPEEKILPPEEFRMTPFLIYLTNENGERKYRCTSCGICSKVCPTQCIYITRKKDDVTGKPIPSPEKFFIDTDKCMNCGSCAEFCPFDAIKMDHDFEIATYERGESHIYNKEKLGKPLEYYSKIRPINFAREEALKIEKTSVIHPG